MSTTTQSFTVTGMSCEHCRTAVSEQVGELEGVSDVDVDLASGRLTVTGEDVSAQIVAEAVEEAGYELAEP